MNVFQIGLILIMLGSSSNTFTAELAFKPFNINSYGHILQGNEGKEFTLIFWSTTCSPCIKELALISDSKMYENHKFVFVSIDYDLGSEDIATIVKRMHLESLEHWQFQKQKIQEIINSVDENWYGEVPRNYYFDEDHNRSVLRLIR